MIVIGEEEDILVSHLSSFYYIDVDGQTVETPFQDLEVVSDVVVQPMEEHQKSETSMASWKGAKAEARNTEGWCKVFELPKK